MEESLLQSYQSAVKQALKMADFQTALASLEELNGAFDLGLDNLIIQQYQRVAQGEKQVLSGLLTSEQQTVLNNQISAAITSISNDWAPKKLALKNVSLSLKAVRPSANSSVPLFAEQIGGDGKMVKTASEGSAEIVKLEKIIAGKTFLDVNWLKRADEKSKAICRIVCANREVGTGWLIAGGYLITNHHVLEDKTIAATAVAQFDYEKDSSGGTKDLVEYKFDVSDFTCDPTLDVARAKLIDNPAKPLSKWGFFETTETAVPLQNEGVSIMQHPEGSEKKITFGEVLFQKGMFVWHNAPTLGGSSGSPILNKDLRVFALHHAGVKKAFDGTGIVKEANEGILW